MIGVGFIGYGGMAGWHANFLRDIKGIKTLAAYDIDPARVKAATADKLTGYSKLDDLLGDKKINLVIVATPNDVHKELSVAAMNAGKNVVCEKPVAMNEGELDEMIAASARNKVLFTVHQNRRWDRDYRVAKKIYEDGMIGNVFNIESRLHGTGGVCHGWRGVAKQGGGMLYDWGVHLIDQLLWMLPGKIDHVYCQQFSIKTHGCDDYFKLSIKFKSGLNCLVEVGTYCVRGLPRWYINGDEGGVTINGFDGVAGGITRTLRLKEKFEAAIVQTAAGPTRTFAPQPPETMVDSELPPVETDLKDYFNNIRDVIEGKAEQIVKHKELKRVMRVIDTAFESARSGKSIQFKEV